MKKLIILGLILALSLTSMAVEIKGDKVIGGIGSSIELKEYKRIVVTDPAVIETMYLLGAEDRLVGIGTTRSEIWPEEKTSKIPSVGVITNPTIEEIIAKEPDLVIMYGASSRLMPILEAQEIEVLINEGLKGYEYVLNDTVVYGKLFGKEKEALKIKEDNMKILERITKENASKKRKMKGLMLYSSSPTRAFIGGLPGEVFRVLGIENIANDLRIQEGVVSNEFILEKNPEIIFGGMGMSYEEIIKANPVIKETIAGQKENFIETNPKDLLRGSPRIFLELEKLNEKVKEIEKRNNIN